MDQISSYRAKELIRMANAGKLPTLDDVAYVKDEIEALRQMVLELNAKAETHERALRKARKIISGLQGQEKEGE